MSKGPQKSTRDADFDLVEEFIKDEIEVRQSSFLDDSESEGCGYIGQAIAAREALCRFYKASRPNTPLTREEIVEVLGLWLYQNHTIYDYDGAALADAVKHAGEIIDKQMGDHKPCAAFAGKAPQ